MAEYTIILFIFYSHKQYNMVKLCTIKLENGGIMIKLCKINWDNVWKVIGLSVNENQKDFVAPNDRSIIEAYLTITDGSVALPFAIYNDDTPFEPENIAAKSLYSSFGFKENGEINGDEIVMVAKL